ncbi:MAG: hypothetical protein IJR50_09115 [Treponema sp.]|nr:hypothetical protein [Treponema sp.]
MTEKFALCADIGTTSLKAALIDKNGNMAAFSQKVFVNPDGEKVAHNWLPALYSAVQEMNMHAKEICALCISGNGPTIVSEDGTTLLWNEPIDKIACAKTAAENTSIRSLFIPRLLAFRERFPAQWNMSRFVYSGPEYAIWQLTGKNLTILPEMRYGETYWTDEQLELVALEREKLPPFANIAHNTGMTTPKATARLGLHKPIPVFCGGPDFIAAMIGTGSLYAGALYDCAGSSEGVNLCTAHQIHEQGMRNLPSVASGLWNAAVLQQKSGLRFVTYKKKFEAHMNNEISYAELIEQSIADKSSEGFSILEELAVNFRNAVNALINVAEKNHITVQLPIIVTGGQAKNDVWMQMKCNYAHVPLATCTCTDAELLGNAACAFYGLGVHKSLTDAAKSIVKIARRYEPDQLR